MLHRARAVAPGRRHGSGSPTVLRSVPSGPRETDRVTGRKPPADLGPAAPGDRAEPDHRASRQPLACARIGDDVRQRVLHPAGAPAPHTSPLTRTFMFQRAQDGQELRRRDDNGTERGPEVLGLRLHQALDHLAELHVAGAEVIDQHETAHHAKGLLGCQIAAVPGDDDPDLQLVVSRTWAYAGQRTVSPSPMNVAGFPL